MELYLTGGVLFSLLCDIKKKPISKSEKRSHKKDPASELEMMVGLCEIVLGQDYTGNKESLRSKLTSYKNCECNGDTLIPLEKKDYSFIDHTDVGTNLEFNEGTRKRILVFISRFINTDDRKAIVRFVDTVNEIIVTDETLANEDSCLSFVNSIIRNSEANEMPFDSYLYRVICCVIDAHADNRLGKETLNYIRNESYNPAPTSVRIVFEEIPNNIVTKYISEIKDHINPRDGWETYIKNLKKDYSNVKIFYDPDREYPINKIYVPSSISVFDPKSVLYANSSQPKRICPSVTWFTELKRYTIISGSGGLGKTMMMRHLLLDAIENLKYSVPIFISVSYFTDEYDDFIDFIYMQCKQYAPTLSKHTLLDSLKASRCMLFLDGFDEIPFKYLNAFVIEFNSFLRTDPGNTVLMSSRPVSGTLPNHLSTIYILPLSEEQSFDLIDKLTRLQEKQDLGDSFKKALVEHLFASHKEYVENPLLLTLMLRIYEQNKRIPEYRFDFYLEAYQVLSHKHDVLNKEFGFERQFKTGLNPTDFSYCVREFCAYSLLEGKTTFKQSDFMKYYEMIKIKKVNNWSFDLDSFIYDCTVTTGLMYYQGEHYCFIHRSMQEFFCAWFITNQEDRLLLDIVLKLQSYGKGLVWETLLLLEERIPSKMEKYVYLPYLTGVFKEDKDHLHDGYTNFLFRFYNDIRYRNGDAISVLFKEVEPLEALFSFCKRNICTPIYDGELEFEPVEEFKEDDADEPFYATDTSDNKRVNIVGSTYSFEVSSVIANRDEYPDIVDELYRQDFQIRKEYERMREYWILLKEKYGNDNDSSDLFAQLH